MNAQQTEMMCIQCGSAVWIEDGAYSCECYEIPLYQITVGNIDFPKFWVDAETKEPEAKP